MTSTSVPLDQLTWGNGIVLPDEDLLPSRLSEDSGNLTIAPWLAPPEPPSPASVKHSQSPHKLSTSRILLKTRSSTHFKKARKSEVHSIADTVSSHDSVDTSQRSTKGNGLMNTIKKKASQKFSKTVSSSLRSSRSTRFDDLGSLPPMPAFSSTTTLSNSSSIAFNTTFGRGKKSKKQKYMDMDEFGQLASPGDTQLVLDTNLDDMDGIIDTSAISHMPTARGSLGCSTASDSIDFSDRDFIQPSSFTASESYSNISLVQYGLDAQRNVVPPIFTDPFSNDRPLRLQQSTSVSSMGVPSKLSPKSHLAPHLLRPTRRPLSDVPRQDKCLPLLPPPGPSDGGSTLPSWFPPESWAVHEDNTVDYVASSDESDSWEILPEEDGVSSAVSKRQITSSKRIGHSSRPGKEFGIGAFSSGIGQWKGKGREVEVEIDDFLTGKPRSFSGPGSVIYALRVYRTDGKMYRIRLPLTASVLDLTENMYKRLGNVKRESHRLYLQERGRERLLAPTEQPAMIVKRRLEQTGYEVVDKLDELGAEDLSFLMKFVFKSVRLGGNEEDGYSYENFEHLDLTGRSLQAIPAIVHAHASNIVSLNLSKNPLLEIPLDFIQSCESLREVRLSHMAMKRVPQSLRHCATLHRLDISCNRIPELDDSGLDMVQLQLLKAQNNRLSRLPDYFSRMRTLKYLTISNNKFDNLPQVVCEIASLIDLDVSFNLLSGLPEEISQLVQLEKLIVVGNQITSLPYGCCKLRALKELDCRRNLIDDISLVARLPKLETLRADHNVLHFLDFSFGPRLETLDVSYNDITKLLASHEDTSSESYALRSLDLSHAKLSSLDNLPFHKLKVLQTLRLDYNSFRSLPDSIGLMTQLREFSCTNNLLGALPENIGHLQNLEKVNVQHNNLKEIPGTLWSCVALLSLNATSNLLKVWHAPVEPSPQSTKSSNPPEPRVTSLSQSASLAYSLRHLYLGDNQLDEEVFSVLIKLQNLEILNLSFNEIQDIPRWYFGGATQLQELYFSGNKLSNLPAEDLYRMTKLRALYMNGNKLVTLPAELSKCINLEVLDVGSNLLKYNINNWEFDWNWNFNGKLKYLNFSGNKRFEIKPQRGQKYLHPPQGVSEAEFAEFNGLKALRVLGLMDVMTMFVPTLPDDTEDRRVRTSAKEAGGLGFGLADTLGRMDQLVMQDLVVSEFRQRKNESVFGMFGRVASTCSSSFASKFLRDEFCALFESELDALTPLESVGDALRRSFLKLNQRLYNDLVRGGTRKPSTASTSMNITNSSLQKVGASGIVAYLINKQLYVANVGDALAVLSRRGTAILVSKRHDPFERSEIIRIRAAEGWVSPKGMVNDEFELSRSFGMFNLLPAVNARPEIHSEILTDGDEFVIIATRSIWDYVSYQTAVDIARVDRQNPMLAAQKLRDFAISYGADGSTMVMILSVADLFEPPRMAPEPRGPRWSKDGVDDKRLLRLSPEVPPPVGHVALVFTDIRNSTHLWEVNPGMRTAMHLHNGLLRRLLRNIGGYEVKTEGDAFMVSFPSVFPAVLWCLSVQLQLLAADWPLEILESQDGKEIYDDDDTLLARGLSVRMGIHVGIPNCEPDPITRRMDYFGPMVNRAARIQGSAMGGQIMCSVEVIRELQEVVPMDSNPSAKLENLDPSTLRAIDEIKRIKYEIVHVGQKRMKGLELPQVVSLIYPKELFGRHALQQRIGEETTGTFSSQPQINMELINQLGLLCVRLEFLTSSRVFRSITQQRSEGPGVEDEEVESNILYADPSSLFPPIPDNAPATHLILVLDMLSVRILNALTKIESDCGALKTEALTLTRRVVEDASNL